MELHFSNNLVLSWHSITIRMREILLSYLCSSGSGMDVIMLYQLDQWSATDVPLHGIRCAMNF
jgi:hypothetical protein